MAESFGGLITRVQNLLFDGVEEPIREFAEAVATMAPLHHTTLRFEAWCECPECERHACHWLRAPRTDPIPDLPEVAPAPSGMALWSSLYSNTVLLPLPEPSEPRMKPNPEAAFEVIRTCVACAHEWGMT
ncbi:hypothetical protein [Nocardia sp. NBC_01388]|uniref:hypothetical protein n=1 Tax=Nocardia sp. NBC_01388 TaxID=2903596 RepID=UPI003252A982